jgi:hypothetical protein
MMDALWAATEELQQVLPRALERVDDARDWDLDERLADGQLRMRTGYFSALRSVAVELGTVDSVVVDVRRNADPRFLVCTGLAGGWVKPELGAAEFEDLRTVLQRLNIERQARRRRDEGLYAVVWWVPLEWEESLETGWLDGICDALCGDQGPRYVAIWPIGHFEARGAPWALSAAVRAELDWLLR